MEPGRLARRALRDDISAGGLPRPVHNLIVLTN